MSIGSVLIGIAVLAVVVAYLARPFRPFATASVDRSIEAWVAQAKAEDLAAEEQGRRELSDKRRKPAERGTAIEPMNYCPQCGRRVDRDDRFCSGCGKRLTGGPA